MEQGLAGHFTFRRLIGFCIPPIFMMIFTSIYGVVDGFFISNYVGKTAFASINLIFPFIMILGGMGFMVGTGGSALVARILGEGDSERAKRYFTMLVKFTVVLGIVCSLLGYLFMPKISHLLGATEEMLADCVAYGRMMFLFITAFMLQNVFQSFLSTASKPKLGLFYTLAAGISNMILDYVFVGLFRWGVNGAALASGFGQVIGGILPVFYFAHKNDSLLCFVDTKLDFGVILQACINGSSELMNNISSSLVGMLFNLQLLKYYGANGVAAYGVLMYVQFVFIAVFIGYTIAVSPPISFNYGAGNHHELHNLHLKSLLFVIVAGSIMAVVSQYLCYPLSGLFVGYDVELYELTVTALKMLGLAFVLMGINFYSSSLFTALNNGLISAGISFVRTLIIQLSALYILPLLLGKEGIWYTFMVTEVFALVIDVVIVNRYRKVYGY